MQAKSLILMSDNRDLTDSLDSANYNSLTAFINFKYAIQNGYDFKYFRPGLDEEFPTFNCFSKLGNRRYSPWSKILSCIVASRELSQYSTIIYIDSDCIFNNFNSKIEDYLYKLPTLPEYSSDSPVFTMLNDKPYCYELPCTGFFMFNRSSRADDILRAWYCNSNDETFQYYDENHTWEQAVFQKLLPDFKNSIRVVDDFMFIDNSPTQLLRHIGSNENHLRIPTFIQKIDELGITPDFEESMSLLKTQIWVYDTQKIVDSL